MGLYAVFVVGLGLIDTGLLASLELVASHCCGSVLELHIILKWLYKGYVGLPL